MPVGGFAAGIEITRLPISGRHHLARLLSPGALTPVSLFESALQAAAAIVAFLVLHDLYMHAQFKTMVADIFPFLFISGSAAYFIWRFFDR